VTALKNAVLNVLRDFDPLNLGRSNLSQALAGFFPTRGINRGRFELITLGR
jgi:hypothetical protein